MSKYINIILFSFLGILTINYSFGLAFYIPYICYYGYKNYKNILLMIPLSLFSVYIFNLNCYVELIVIYLLLIFITIIIKKNKNIYYTIFSFIMSAISYFMIEGNNIITCLLTSIFTSIIFLFLLYNNKTSNNVNNKIKSIIYNEIILALILSFGTLNYNLLSISISFLISVYYTMYFSSNKHYLGSIIYSILCSYILYKFQSINYSMIIMITSVIYCIPRFYHLFIYIMFMLYTYIMYDFLPNNIYIILFIIMIIFEILRISINKEIEDDKIIDSIYERTINQIDMELQSFSLFLDKILNNLDNNEYNNEIGNQITKLTNNICLKCDKRIECYKKNKGELYYYFKGLLTSNPTNFICEHSDEMNRLGRQLGNNLLNKKAYTNDIITPVLNGISVILKNYTLDHNIEMELDLNIFKKVKKGLVDYGYSISMYNVIKTFKSSFLIELCLIGISFFDEKENLENIISYYINCPSTVILKEIKKSKTYVTIVPKMNYEIAYGYGSISKVGNNICGDNYWVKNLASNKLAAVICDGMGKGINASIISTRTLKLLDELLDSNISSDTSISILNTLYYIQDYLENYTTLDYVEINKNTGEMTMYKAGATYTYIVHKDGSMDKIENENLPFGLNELIISKKIILKDEDLILLASDGIFDNIIDVKDLEEFIINIKNLEPQKISYEILNYARKTDVISKDDMSIITLKIKSLF